MVDNQYKYIRFTIIFLFLSAPAGLLAQNPQNDSIVSAELKQAGCQFRNSLKVPAIFLGASMIALTENEIFSNEEAVEERNKRFPDFHTHVDNFLPFAPIALVYGLDLVGVKAKHPVSEQTALLIKSELLMLAMVVPLKRFTNSIRPDQSNRYSFPSGHTAQAFMAATFLSKEYGERSLLYPVFAYTTASAVGVMRMLNNKHYLTDVLAGAAIGILSTQLVYFAHSAHKIRQHHLTRLTVLPYYEGGSAGLNLQLHFP